MFKSLTPTLSILAALILFFLFTKPQYAEIQMTLNEIGQYEAAIEDYKNYNATLETRLAEKNAVQTADRVRLDTLVPQVIDVPRTLIEIEDIARKNQMLFGNLTIVDSTTSGGSSETLIQNPDGTYGSSETPSREYIRKRISFEVIGTYGQFKSFLRMIESNLTLMEVVEMSLGTGTDTFQQYAVTVEIYALSE